MRVGAVVHFIAAEQHLDDQPERIGQEQGDPDTQDRASKRIADSAFRSSDQVDVLEIGDQADTNDYQTNPNDPVYDIEQRQLIQV